MQKPDIRSRSAKTTPSSEVSASSGEPPRSDAAVTISAGPSQNGAPPRTAPRSLPETFMDERDDVLAVINELEDQLDRYEEIRAALERDLNEATEQLQQSRQRAQELEWQASTLEARIEAHEQTRQELASVEAQLAEANSRNQRINDEITQSQADQQRTVAELKAANKQLEEFWQVRKERDGLRSDIKTIKLRLDEIERGRRELVEERAQTQARLDEALTTLEESRSTRQQAERSLRESQDQNHELRQMVDSLAQKIEALKNERKGAQAQLLKLERENVRMLEQQKSLLGEVASLRGMNRTAEGALANVKKAFAEVRVALSETKTRARRRTLDGWARGLAPAELSEELPAGGLNGVAVHAAATDELLAAGAAREETFPD